MSKLRSKIELIAFCSLPFIVLGSIIIYNCINYGTEMYIGFF